MVGFRSGGESCRVGTGRFRRTLKKLFQENGVPPWDRGRIPLILLDGQLAAVAGRWVCEPFRADDGRPGVEILWNRIDV
jgi:tRNA(Ile)-lysidine synthase